MDGRKNEEFRLKSGSWEIRMNLQATLSVLIGTSWTPIQGQREAIRGTNRSPCS